MSKLKYLMQQFQLKNCVFTAVRQIFQNSKETDFSFRPSKIKGRVSVKQGTKEKGLFGVKLAKTTVS